MADSALITYGGLIASIVSAIAAHLAWVRAGRIKALDLRLELARSEVQIIAIASELPALLKLARRSREPVTGSTGQAGALQQWLQEWEADSSAVSEFATWLPPANPERTHLAHHELETRVITAAKLLAKANFLKEKYRESLSMDDNERNQIRADVRSVTHARLQQYDK